MTALPLVQISEERRQRELRHALERSGADPAARRRFHVLVLFCLGCLFLGYGLLGLAFHLTDPDRAQAAFLAAILVANGGPAWTLVTSYCLAQQR
jgi:hypothetical protein